MARYQQHAKNVNIIRDNFGIPHIYGKSDADAVFGLLYAQCEDDFNRVETNYIEKLGRLAEVNGEKDLYDDLLIRMVIDSADAISDYKTSPPWLHKLLDAFADGVNYYLYKHPNVKPHLLTHFEPWYALLWTDGSIGSITTADFTAKDLKNLYGTETGDIYKIKDYDNSLVQLRQKEEEYATGSNGFAFSPNITESKNAILYINPHVSFYYRPEVQVVSEEGLNAYGAVTWGQFFVYQGFNEHCGWMHTSSHADVSDAYIEKVSTENNKRVYEYDGQKRAVTTKNITLRYCRGVLHTPNNNGENNNTGVFNTPLQQTTIKAMYTHHGPIMGKRNGKLVSVRSNNRSMTSLIQSWQRTKAKSFAEFKKVLYLKANASNNEVYADAEGNIAYWHGNFMPIRDKNLNWQKPVDGTTSATEWKGLHMVDELVQSINPKNGWVQNCNSSAFTVAGDNSPKKEDYPTYMAPDGENYRGVLAVRILPKEKNYTIDKVISTAYDKRILFFENLVPALVKHFEALPANDSMRALLTEPIQTLKSWDFASGENSVPTTLAVNWGSKLMEAINATINLDDFDDQVTRTERFAVSGDPKIFISTFAATINDLNKVYGKWNIPFGEINRVQRINDDIEWRFDDAKPSIPVGYTSSQWGQISSVRSIRTEGTKKFYGVNGNSFVCAVEFGKRVKAKSLLAGGECGDPNSKHFTDQLEMYAHGQFKDVLFYKEDVLKHVEKQYHP